MLTGLSKGEGESLVLRDGLLQLTLGLEEFLLQGADALGGVLDTPPEHVELLLEPLGLLGQLGDFSLVTRDPERILVGVGHSGNLL